MSNPPGDQSKMTPKADTKPKRRYRKPKPQMEAQKSGSQVNQMSIGESSSHIVNVSPAKAPPKNDVTSANTNKKSKRRNRKPKSQNQVDEPASQVIQMPPEGKGPASQVDLTPFKGKEPASKADPIPPRKASKSKRRKDTSKSQPQAEALAIQTDQLPPGKPSSHADQMPEKANGNSKHRPRKPKAQKQEQTSSQTTQMPENANENSKPRPRKPKAPRQAHPSPQATQMPANASEKSKRRPRKSKAQKREQTSSQATQMPAEVTGNFNCTQHRPENRKMVEQPSKKTHEVPVNQPSKPKGRNRKPKSQREVQAAPPRASLMQPALPLKPVPVYNNTLQVRRSNEHGKQDQPAVNAQVPPVGKYSEQSEQDVPVPNTKSCTAKKDKEHSMHDQPVDPLQAYTAVRSHSSSDHQAFDIEELLNKKPNKPVRPFLHPRSSFCAEPIILSRFLNQTPRIPRHEAFRDSDAISESCMEIRFGVSLSAVEEHSASSCGKCAEGLELLKRLFNLPTKNTGENPGDVNEGLKLLKGLLGLDK